MSEKKPDKAYLDYAEVALSRISQLNAGKRFHAKQQELFQAIFRDGYKRVFIFKGRKAGGTESLLYIAARVMGTIDNSVSYIIGPTQKGQCETVWDNRKIHAYIPKQWKPQANETDKRIRLGVNDSYVKIEGGDDPDRCRNLNEGDLFAWDEAKDHRALSLEFCLPNVFPRDGIWIINGTPPTKKSNHYYQTYQHIKNDPEWKVIRMTAWDNPFFPGGHKRLQQLKNQYYARGEGWIWEVEWEGRFFFSGARKVLPRFDEKNQLPRSVLMEMIGPDKHHLKWVCCIDPGYRTCFAVLFAAYNPYTAQVYFLDEIYSTERAENSARDMWPEIRRKQKELWDGKWSTLYDSAALSFAVEVNALTRGEQDRPLLIPVQKAAQDEENYFRTWNGACHEDGQFYVALDACRKTIWEMENYELEEVKGGMNAGDLRYPDINNHQLDNGRYIFKFLNYTGQLNMLSKPVVDKEPRIRSLSSAWAEKERQQDFVGYGGFNADFDINKIIH